MYPALAGQDLTVSSTTQTHELGVEMMFRHSSGELSWARYIQNGAGATLAAGLPVVFADKFGRVDTAGMSLTLQPLHLAGILAASLADGGFGWAVYRGRFSAANLSVTLASSAGERWLSVNSAAALVTVGTFASTDASHAIVNNRLLGILRSTSTTVNSGTASNGIVDLFWR